MKDYTYIDPLKVKSLKYIVDSSINVVLEEAAKKMENFPEDKILMFYERGPNDPPGNMYVPVTNAHRAAAIRALKKEIKE